MTSVKIHFNVEKLTEIILFRREKDTGSFQNLVVGVSLISDLIDNDVD